MIIEAKPVVFYHGEQAPQMFTYRCRNCWHTVNNLQRACTQCGCKLVWQGLKPEWKKVP